MMGLVNMTAKAISTFVDCIVWDARTFDSTLTSVIGISGYSNFNLADAGGFSCVFFVLEGGEGVGGGERGKVDE